MIQCHDFPDADAISSGFGVYTYLKRHGKAVRLVYSGKSKMTKPNLIMPERIRRNSKAGIHLKVHCPLFRPPFTCRIRVIRPNTGEHWIMRNGNFLPTDDCGGFLIRVERPYV